MKSTTSVTTLHEVVEQFVRRHNVKIFGNSLSRRDQETFFSTMEVWILMFFTKANLAEYTPQQFHFELTRSFSWVFKLDIAETFQILKDSDGALCDHQNRSYGDITRPLSANGRRLLGGLYPLLQADWVGWYVCQDVPSFRRLHHLLVFPGRLTLKDVPGLEAAALQDYLDFEEQFVETTPSSWMVDRIAELFPRSVANPFTIDPQVHHGPGAVAEGTTDLLDKWKLLGSDQLLRYYYRDDPSSLEYPLQNYAGFTRRARIVFVPKSATKLRTICMEPATLMYHQQGAMHAIVRQIERSGSSGLAHRIKLDDQSQNRELALEGSLTGDLCTIDLSNASDSVGWAFCKALFRKSSLLSTIFALRSTSAELPNGQEIHMKKFAPMGSALCFPIECLVFSMIIEDAIVRCGHNPRNSRYSVYGDDLIIEKAYAPSLIENLVRYGFQPNVEKSYYTDSWFTFRESCGGEYVNGYDVTPCKISRKFSGFSGVTSSVVPSLVDLANRLKDADFDVARNYVIAKTSKYGVPFSNAPGLFLNSKNPSSIFSRWNEGLQRPEERGFCLKPLSYECALTDENERVLYAQALQNLSYRDTRLNLTGQLLPIESNGDIHRIPKRGARASRRFYSEAELQKEINPSSLTLGYPNLG